MYKILIVDDDRTVRTVLNGIAKKSGCAGICASNGMRAKRILEDNTDISAVITDLAMPELDGRGLVEDLRASTKWSKIPILVVSGVASHSELISLLDVGATECLPKPLSPHRVGDFLDQYVHKTV